MVPNIKNTFSKAIKKGPVFLSKRISLEALGLYFTGPGPKVLIENEVRVIDPINRELNHWILGNSNSRDGPRRDSYRKRITIHCKFPIWNGIVGSITTHKDRQNLLVNVNRDTSNISKCKSGSLLSRSILSCNCCSCRHFLSPH